MNFILVVYSNASHLTYSFVGPLAMARRVIYMNSVRPSVRKFLWPSLGCFECIGKFSFFFQFFNFFLNLIYNESLITAVTAITVSLQFLVPDIRPKMLLANQITGFFNQSPDFKSGCISME